MSATAKPKTKQSYLSSASYEIPKCQWMLETAIEFLEDCKRKGNCEFKIDTKRDEPWTTIDIDFSYYPDVIKFSGFDKALRRIQKKYTILKPA